MESEIFVEKLFLQKYGLKLSKISKSELKTPDYTIKHDGELICIAELKTIERIRSEEAGWKISSDCDIQEYTRDDNAVTRVAKKIHEAYKQLKHYKQPKALIFLNQDSLVDIGDLEEAYSGYTIYSNEKTQYINEASMNIANGRIKDEKKIIDLYIWIDKPENKVFHRCTTQVGHNLMYKYFINSFP